MSKLPNEHIVATHWPCGIEWNNSKSEPNRGFEFHENYHPESIDLLNHYQGYDYGYDYNENQSYQNNSEEVKNIESTQASQEYNNQYDPNYPEI